MRHDAPQCAKIFGRSLVQFGKAVVKPSPYLHQCAGVVEWQTRTIQGRVLARAWRFKSSHPHQFKKPEANSSPAFFIFPISRKPQVEDGNFCRFSAAALPAILKR